MANSRDERINALKTLETSGNYFSLNLPNGLLPGSSIEIFINENGDMVLQSGASDTGDSSCGNDDLQINTDIMAGFEPTLDNIYKSINDMDDPILKQILSDGVVRNTKLHRRWVMAQMFRAKNYIGESAYNRNGNIKNTSGYNSYVRNCLGFMYQFRMMENEIEVLSELSEKDKECFDERKRFFSIDRIIKIYSTYLLDLTCYICSLETKRYYNGRSSRHNGRPYVSINGVNYFMDNNDIDTKLLSKISQLIDDMKQCETYGQLLEKVKEVNKHYLVNFRKNHVYEEWLNAFKGAGAFYTCKNLIMFHNCFVHDKDTGVVYDTINSSMIILNKHTDAYNTEKPNYWRLYAFMNKLIYDNKFDFNDAMRKAYSVD